MTAAELIERLKELDPDTVLHIYADRAGHPMPIDPSGEGIHVWDGQVGIYY